MKNENVRKINSLGKISRIIIIILKVAVLIAAIGLLVGSLLCLAIPKDSIRISGSATAEMVVDNNSFVDEIIKIDDVHFDSNLFGAKLKCILQDNGVTNDERIFTLDAAANDINSGHIKYSIAAVCFLGAVYCSIFFVILCLAHKFAKSLEICNSPFEENVIKHMKKFGISLIPWAGITLLISGNLNGIVVTLIVFVIFLFISIFKYGAQLQQESDETL